MEYAQIAHGRKRRINSKATEQNNCPGEAGRATYIGTGAIQARE